MRPRRELPILRYVREFVRARGDRDDTDVQLLGRFAARRDPDAFAELVARHGPLVWGVCRRQLVRLEDAEDAFQATFLVLLRKAGSLRRPERLANWLYGVACRTAAKARVAAATRAAREQHAARDSAAEPVDEVLWRDVRSLLDDEVQRLPDRYRTPFVLCYLEGLTQQQAARQLGCPEGTVTSRLSWARQRLRSRLARRGLTLSAAAVTATVFDAAAPAAVPGMLAARIAAGATSELSARVLALAEGVLQSMWLNQLKYRASLVVLTGLAFAGVGTLTRNALAQKPQPAEPQKETKAAPAPADAEGAVQVVRPKLGKDVVVTTPVRQVRVEPYYRAELRSRAGGAVKAVNVVIGSSVKRGDVLVEMDVPELLQSVREKNAVVDQRRIELVTTQKLFKKAVVTDVEVDIKAAQLEAARADLDRAKSLLDGATVRAPFDGVVVRRAVDPGSVVAKDSEPLLTLERQDVVTLVLQLPEDVAPFVAIGAEVSFWFGRFQTPDLLVHTKVSRIAPSINGANSTVRVEADLWNDTEASYKRYVASEMKKPEKERFADLKQRQPPPFPRVTGDVPRRDGRLLLPGMSGGGAVAIHRYQNDLFLPRSVFFQVPIRPSIPSASGMSVTVIENGKVRRRRAYVKGVTGDDRLMFQCGFYDEDRETPFTGKELFVLKDQDKLQDGQEVKTVLVPDWDKAGTPRH